jgi:sulfate permease, SulP family
MNSTKRAFFSLINQNWKSGLTVALVSLPLSVSIAVASGASPLNGIITAVWAGLIASFFASSHYNIVGPAGALTAILAAAALQFGAGSLSSIAIVAGIFILLAWVFRLDKYIAYIPSSVIHGFTLSVAIVIGLNQLNFALGLENLPKHAHFVENVMESFRNIDLADSVTTGFFILSLGFMFLTLRLLPKVPGAVLLAPIAIVIGYLAEKGSLPLSLLTLGEVFPNLSLSIFSIPKFTFSNAYLLPAATVALVAILETEISAKIADKMTRTKHDQRKEMFGLGLANIGAGFFGGLPASGVFVRTSLNVRSHATHRTSQGINAVLVAIISIILLTSFTYIPMAAIAAILVFASIRMVEMHHFKHLYKYNKFAFATALVVAAISTYEDPMIGILVGTVISLITMIEHISKGQFELVVNKDKQIVDRIVGHETHKSLKVAEDAQVCVYSIKGYLTHVNAESHGKRFDEKIAKCGTVLLRLRELLYIDADGLDTLDEMILSVQKHGGQISVSGVNPLIEQQLMHSKKFQELLAQNKVYDRASHALNAIGYEL